MSIAWLQHCSALVLFLYFPWFPPFPLLPPEAQPQAVAVESGVVGESQTAAPAPEEPLVLPGVVIEEIPKGSALEKAGLQAGDVILTWERLPNPPANPEGARGKIDNPFDWMWLEIEQAPRGRMVLSYARKGHVTLAHVSEGHWGAIVRSRLSKDTATRFATLKSQIENTKGEFGIAELNKELEVFRKTIDPEVMSYQLLKIGDLYARFSHWESANSAYQEALSGLDDELFRAMVVSSLASLYRNRNMIDEAIALSNQASKQYQAASAHTFFARELQRLSRVYAARNAYPQAIEALDKAVEVLEENCPVSLAHASILNSRGILRREIRNFSGARSDHESALNISKNLAPCGDHEASTLLGLGNILYIQGDFDQAEKVYQEVLSIREMTAPDSLPMASALSSLANIHDRRGETADSLLLNEHALRIRMAHVPDSLAVADSLNNIGMDYKDLGDLWSAESFLEQSLEIRSSLAPGTLAEAETISNLGLIALGREKFDRAILLFSKAYYLLKPLSQGKAYLAGVLGNLGTAYLGIGEVVIAEKFFTESLENLNKISASAPEIATTLLNLGNVSYRRADYELAGERYREAARTFNRLGKNSREVSVCLANLAAVALRLHRLEEAAALYKESFAVEEVIAPHGPEISRILTSMGLIYLEQGKLSEAESFTSRAALIERKNGRTLGEARALVNLGEIAMKKRQYSKAREHYGQALILFNKNKGTPIDRAEVLFNLGWLHKEIAEYSRARSFLLEAQKESTEWGKDTWFEAEIEHALGSIAQSLGETKTAQVAFINAVRAIEKQVMRLDPQPSDRRQFREKYREFYGSLLANLVSTGDLREGFAISEQGRARSFLETLSIRKLETEGRIVSPATKPSDLGAIEARKMQISETLSEALEPVGEGARQRNIEELLRLRQEYGDVLRGLSQGSHHPTNLYDPKVLDVDAALESLEPSTALLSYWTSDKRTFLFVFTRKGVLRVYNLPIDQNSLKKRIWRLRNLINAAASRTAVGELRNREVKRLGRELYQLLISPAEDQIEASERVLVAPDGPLHYLPFGALVREVSEGDGHLRDQYLAEWKPFHSVLSVTLYAEIQRNRLQDLGNAKRSALNLVAFGDPQFAIGINEKEPDSIADFRVRSAVRRGAVSFEPLHFSRREIEGIVALFPPERVQMFVGADATEERAKAVGKEARILHFATHARLDDQFPLDSALVLTMPQGFPSDRDNGLLQVSEIFEKVRLDADLVVLSGCETALGEEQGGEGLIGLTRAFQYAGARTVMASLWSVQDQATSELMIRFYKHLRAGLPKDEALRQAQTELIRGPIEVVNEKGEKTLLDASAPYFWAGFQIYGDWQ